MTTGQTTIQVPHGPFAAAPTMIDHGARAGLAFIASVLAACVWGGILLVMLFIVPKYEEIFRDFGVALPWVTRATINASHWLRGQGAGQSVPGLLVAGPVLLGVIATLAAMGVPRRTRSMAIVLLLLLVAAGVVLFAAGFVSFHNALLSMTESLQGGKL